jgi:hypothetical protein
LKADPPYMLEDLAGNLGATQMKITGLDHQEFSTE